MKPLVPMLFLIAAALPACAADWKVLSAVWRPDANPHAKTQAWDGTIWSEGWREAEQFWPKNFHPSGSIHAVLRNDSGQPRTLRLTHVNGKPLAEAATKPDRAGDVIWYVVDSPQVKAGEDEDAFDARIVPPGEWAECKVRLRKPLQGPAVLRFEAGSSAPLDVAVSAAAPRVRVESLAFSPAMDRVFVYLKGLDGKAPRPGAAGIPGVKISRQRWVEGPRGSALAAGEIRLEKPLTMGAYHLLTIRAGNETIAQPFRAWDSFFPIALFGELNEENVRDAKAHGINTYFAQPTEMLDKAGMNTIPHGWENPVGARKEGSPGVVFHYNHDEPDAHDITRGEDLPIMDRLGVMAQSEVLPLFRLQQRNDPWAPGLLLVDNTYKPLNWYVYGQIADVFFTDPYVPLNGRQLDYVWHALDAARDASAPRPLVAVLWACSLETGREKDYGRRPPSGKELRSMVFYALGSGVRGISYFIDLTQETGEGQFTGISDYPDLWKEAGNTNRDVAAAAPFLSAGCPAGGGESGGVWWRQIMCGPDTMAVVAVNTRHYIGYETRSFFEWHFPLENAEIACPLPRHFRDPRVREVRGGALVPAEAGVRTGVANLRMDTLDTARLFLITNKESEQ